MEKKRHCTYRSTPTVSKYYMTSYESRKTVHHIWLTPVIRCNRGDGGGSGGGVVTVEVVVVVASAVVCVYQIVYTAPLQGVVFFRSLYPSPRFIMIITPQGAAAYIIMCLYKLLFATG